MTTLRRCFIASFSLHLGLIGALFYNSSQNINSGNSLNNLSPEYKVSFYSEDPYLFSIDSPILDSNLSDPKIQIEKQQTSIESLVQISTKKYLDLKLSDLGNKSDQEKISILEKLVKKNRNNSKNKYK